MKRPLNPDQPESPDGAGRKRVLLLEDCADDAELFRIGLDDARLNVELLQVDAERDFRQALDDFAPDVVVSDSTLAGFTGLEAMSLVRTTRPGTPFVFLTGHGDDHPDSVVAMQAADGYLNKDQMAQAPGLLRRLLSRPALD